MKETKKDWVRINNTKKRYGRIKVKGKAKKKER